MNILKITIGHEYDCDFSEYLFRTNRPKSELFDDNQNFTEFFKNWLKENHEWMYSQIEAGRMEDLYYFHEDSLDII